MVAAAKAANRAGVVIRELDAPGATHMAQELFCEVWRAPASATPVTSELMRALALAGNYVGGAFAAGQDGTERLVGASVAFLADGQPRQLHSHISGVLPDLQGRSVGFALKLHQRAWALAHAIPTITWTVDPLVRRNVFFNLAKLAARAVKYLPEMYGQMSDGLNAHDETDRLIISWQLTSDRVVAACEGTAWLVEPVAATEGAGEWLLDVGPDGAPVVGKPTVAMMSCRIPADIVAVRAADPALARAWRRALRDTLGGALASGHQVLGVTRQGCYVLV